jgi:hypothetical protein
MDLELKDRKSSHRKELQGKEPEISFKPINKGLGFHLFADGLPYTSHFKAVPEKKPVPPPSSRQESGDPLLGTQMRQSFRAGAGRSFDGIAQHKSLRSQSTQSQIAVKPGSALPVMPQGVQQEDAFDLSYVMRRVFAYVLDTFLNSLVLGTSFGVTFWFYEVDIKMILDPGIMLITTLLFLGLNWFLIALQELVFQTSMGKYCFHLIIPGSRVRIFLRTLLFIPSAACLGLGLLSIFFTRRRCGLHDLLVEVQPIHVTKL